MWINIWDAGRKKESCNHSTLSLFHSPSAE
jgi:hypothetical protein